MIDLVFSQTMEIEWEKSSNFWILTWHVPVQLETFQVRQKSNFVGGMTNHDRSCVRFSHNFTSCNGEVHGGKKCPKLFQ